MIWETTRACDLACVHCRASAVPRRDPRELSTDEAFRLLDEVRAFAEDGRPAPLMVLTGGDPLKRPDVHEIVAYGTRIGLRMTMTPSGTPLMTPAVLARLRDAGLARLAVSLDGASRAVHDAFRRVPGSFDWTVAMLRAARALGLPTQVNTTITRRTIGDLAAMGDLVADVGAALWSVFVVVPTGRAELGDVPDADAVERALEWLAAHAERAPHDVKTTAAPHYRRVLLQRRTAARRAGGLAAAQAAHAAAPVGVVGRAGGVNDGNGFVFVGHRGDVHPSGFLPVPCGNVRTERLRLIHDMDSGARNGGSAEALVASGGLCASRQGCGGWRARAHAMTGDWRESDPLCAYEPPAWRRAVARGEQEPRAAYFARRVAGWPSGDPSSDP